MSGGVAGRVEATALLLIAALLVAGSASGETLTEVIARVRLEFPEVRQMSVEQLANRLSLRPACDASADGKRATPECSSMCASLCGGTPNEHPPILLDVRSEEEYAVSHLPGAERVESPRDVHDRLRNRQPGQAVVLYCSVGYRSSKLASQLAKEGVGGIYNLEGSIFAWSNQGYPAERRGRRVLAVHPFDAAWGRFLRADRRFDASSTNLLAPDFDDSRHTVPLDSIRSGGPPKDGIPAILRPILVGADAAQLGDSARVVGIVRGTQARAYPIAVLNWHEAVNDTLGEVDLLVTYCPLTGSVLVFDRRVGDRSLTFGVSGKLFESNVLLYDHQTESLWSQLKQESVTGPYAGQALAPLAAIVTTWRDWRRTHPQTLVLTSRTGHRRDYDVNPYERYEESPDLMFDVSRTDHRLPLKARVLGLVVDGHARAYPLSRLPPVGRTRDQIAGRRVEVEHRPSDGRAAAYDAATGTLLPAVSAYWFAWAAFHPATEVWGDPPTRPQGVRRGDGR